MTVVKSIGGAAAGRQSAIELQVTCTPGPTAGTQTAFIIPAGAAAGDYTFTVSGVPEGAECSVAETVDGASTTATLSSTSITPASVSVPPPGEAAPVITVANAYATPVTPVTPVLPATGAEDQITTALAGAVMLLGGIALVAARRRAVSRRS